MRPTPPSHPSHGAASCHRPARLLVASTAVLLGLLPGLPACGLLPQAGGPSSSSATPVVQADGAARQAADPQDLEGPEDSEDSGSSVPLNPLEYGNCTSEEVAEAGQATLAPDELDSSTDRAAAQAEVDHAVAGAESHSWLSPLMSSMKVMCRPLASTALAFRLCLRRATENWALSK